MRTRIPYNPQENTPRRIHFKANVLDNGERANHERRVYARISTRLSQICHFLVVSVPLGLSKFGSQIRPKGCVMLRVILYGSLRGFGYVLVKYAISGDCNGAMPAEVPGIRG